MAFGDFLSGLFTDPVDTSGATNALNSAADRGRGRLQPTADVSAEVRNALRALFFDQGSFQGTDAFRFARDEGINALDRSAAARGTLGSGGQQREIARFASGLASQDRRSEINSLLGFFGQTNPANAQLADIDLNQGKNLASISLGAENARVNSSNNLLGGVLGLGGRALGFLG